jgi:hypothetical protein
VLAGGVVVADKVRWGAGVGLGDLLDLRNPRGMPRVAGTVTLPVETSSAANGAVPDVVVGLLLRYARAVSARFGPMPGPATLVHARHDGLVRRVEESPTTSRTWRRVSGSVENLNASLRQGCRIHWRHTFRYGDVAQPELGGRQPRRPVRRPVAPAAAPWSGPRSAPRRSPPVDRAWVGRPGELRGRHPGQP